MNKSWRDRLKTLIEETPGLSMKRLSLKAGMSESGIRDILSRGASPSIDTFVAIAGAAGVSPAMLLQGDERFALKVPLVGRVSKGEKWKPVTGAIKADPVELEMRDHDVIGLEVEDDSMAPVYRAKDFLVCHRRAGRTAHNLIGLDCVVQTEAGGHYIKILKKGPKTGLFNLKSYNPVVDDIEGVALEWAAPIVWIRRGGR